MADRSKSNQPENTAFKQQRLPAWQPVLTARNVLPTFIIVGLIFIPLGIVLLITSNNCFEVSKPYTNCSSIAEPSRSCYDVITSQISLKQATDCECEIEIPVSRDLTGKVYFYYKLTNFFQNHRVYVKSRDNQQLSGATDKTKDNLDANCEPFRTRTVNGVELPIAPCGTIANSMFNDTFTLTNDAAQNPVVIKRTGIAWTTDHEIKFQNPEYSQCSSLSNPSQGYTECNFGNTTLDVQQTAKPDYWSKPVYDLDPVLQSQNGYENEALEVWMRTAAFPTFRKLYGTVEDLAEGDYKLRIKYNYPTQGFDGTKSFVVAQMTWAGGKNPFLGIAYIVVGALSLLAAIILAVIHFQSRNEGHR